MERGWGAVVVIAVALGGCAAIAGATDLRVLEDDEVAGDAGGSSGSSERPAPAFVGDAEAKEEPLGPSGDAGEAGAPDASRTAVKRVFASSMTYEGNLGGLAGADAKCTQLAQAAGLGGSFVAWLSTGGTFARDRVAGPGPWSRVGELEIAVTKAQLTDPPLAKPIGRTELGGEVNGLVWTGTSADGTFLDGDCSDWTSDSRGQRAATGDALAAGPPWTAATSSNCGARRRLYCFEL